MLRKHSWSAANWRKPRSSWPVTLANRKRPGWEFFFPHFIPHVFLRVQFRRIGWQTQQADVVRFAVATWDCSVDDHDDELAGMREALVTVVSHTFRVHLRAIIQSNSPSIGSPRRRRRQTGARSHCSPQVAPVSEPSNAGFGPCAQTAPRLETSAVRGGLAPLRFQ